MRNRFFLIIFLTFFLLLPSGISADIQLPELDSHHLLISIQQGIIDEWINITASGEFSEPEKQAALFLIRNAVQKRELDYALKDLPRQGLEKMAQLAIFLYFTPDASQILDKIEKESVKKAVQILTDWFLQNEIKVASGKLRDSFTSYKGNQQEVVFYYNLAYHPLDENSGEVAVEFYSPEKIEPEKGRGSIGGLVGFDWDFETWRAQGKERIPPFTVRIKGKVGRTSGGGYQWDRTIRIEIRFNEEMPDFSQIEKEEDIKKIPFLGEYYLRIKSRIEETKALAHRFGITTAISNLKSKVSKKGEDIKASIGSILGKIQSYLSEINPFSPASIVETTPVLPLSQESYPQEEVQEQDKSSQKPSQSIEKVEKEISLIEEKVKEIEPSKIRKKIKEGASPEKIQEELDDIGKRIDLVNQQISELLRKEESELIPESLDEEAVEEKVEGESRIPEPRGEQNIEETINEVGQVLLCPKPPLYVTPRQNRVIFNEIAWMGTTNSPNDEWIELKNISNFPVDISGWQIFDKNQQIKIIFASGTTVLPGAFYLLERTDDSSVPNVKADFIYTGAINDTNEELYLFNERCGLEDRIVVRSGWPAGSKKKKCSMERNKSGHGWHTYYGPAFNGVFGSPKRENSVSPISYTGGGFFQEESLPSSVTENPIEVLITEVQIEGERSFYDFVELYNPSTSSVDISGFQLKKKTSLGKEYSLRVFPEGSSIPPEGYFLWANSEYASSSGIDADVTSSQTLAKDNSIALFDKNKNILDALAWGSSTDPFVEGRPFEQNPGKNRNLARKWDATGQEYQDTNNNSQDFEIQEPTPKNQNLSFAFENELPFAVLEVSLSKAMVGEEIIFEGASSSDPDGRIISFIWDFGDGFSTTTQTSTIVHSYATSGVFTAKLEVVDNNYSTSSPATATIEIFAPTLEVEPSILEFQTEEGQDPLSQSLILRNLSSTSTIWEAFVEYSTSSTSTSWIVLNPSSGTIPVAGSSTLEVSPQSSGLAPGLYQATIFISNRFTTSSIPINLTINPKPTPTLSVVINEIAWMGTKSDANDEWIELYNNTDTEINLDGWQIWVQDDTPFITLSGTIPAHGYFLLERSDDQTISDVEADQIYTGALSNDGEKLQLRDSSGNLVDSVDCSSGWFAGRNTKIKERWIRMSMERINPQLSGDDPSNWMTNNGFNIFGHDSDGNVVQGTPKKENSRYNYSPGDFFYYSNKPLDHDSIFTKEGSPYTFRGTFYIAKDVLLLIEPGVNIQFVCRVSSRNPCIDVEGTLLALGTPEEPIIFGPEGPCQPQSWRYIHLKGPDSVLDNVEVRCGGYEYYLPLTPVFYKGAVWIDNTTATIRNSIFDNNLVAGVWLTNSDSVIENSIFRNHTQVYYTHRASCAIRLEGDSKPILKNLTFENNTFDIYPNP